MKLSFQYARPNKRFALGVLVVVVVMTVAFAAGHHASKVKVHEGGVAPITATVTAPLADTTPPAASTLAPVTFRTSVVSATSCASNPAGRKLLLISISAQHLWACDGANITNQSAVTTGASQAPHGINDSTPTGTWQIYSKQTNQHLRGSDINGSWNDAVAYWMPFDDQIGFHDASWQTFPFGSSQYVTSGSHGCIHLPTDVAGWIYNWAPIGTTVTVTS